MSTQLGPASMDGSHDEFFDLEEVEALAKKKLKKPVSRGRTSCSVAHAS
jgi:hypothetical protein